MRGVKARRLGGAGCKYPMSARERRGRDISYKKKQILVAWLLGMTRGDVEGGLHCVGNRWKRWARASLLQCARPFAREEI